MCTRILFPFLLLVCFNSALFAQWSVGVSGGATMSFRQWNILPLDFDIDYGPGFAFNAALIGEWKPGAVFTLRGEGGYQTWRNRLDIEVTNLEGGYSSGTMSDDLHAWSGGLYVKITPFRQQKIYFLTGPSAAWIVKNQVRLDKHLSKESGEPRKSSLDLKEKGIEPGQYFVNFGLGNAFKCGANGQLTIEARYQHGLSDLSSASTVDARISTLMLNVGYLYQL